MTAHTVSWANDLADDTMDGDWLALAVQRPLSPTSSSPFSLARQFCSQRDQSGASAFATCTLSQDTTSVALARQFTRTTLQSWGLLELVNSTATVASEMVTNALHYGLRGAWQMHGRPVAWLCLVRQGETLLCAVFDPGTDVPVVREPDFFAESGRGLHVVESLSENWGWTHPDRFGKTVWALLPKAGTE